MSFQFYKPSAMLAPFINFYWIMELKNCQNRMENLRIIPNGCIELSFYFGDKLIFTRKNENQEVDKKALISGQTVDYFNIQQTGDTGLFSVLFRPHGVRLFFDQPVTEITNQSIDLEMIFGKDINNITEQIALAADNSVRISIFENYLISKFQDKKEYSFYRISESIKLIDKNKGIVKVDKLANAACLSNKQFDRVFSDFVGLKPKQFLRIVRFQNAIHQKQINGKQNMTELAHTCGYYDQAHFINDFKNLSGYTPKVFFDSCDPVSDYFF